MYYLALPFIFISSTTLSAIAFSLIWGSVNKDIAGLSLLIGAMYSVLCSPHSEKSFASKKFRRWDGIIYALALMVGLDFLLREYFFSQGKWMVMDPIGMKTSLFMAHVTSFLKELPFWPSQNPVLLSESYRDFGFPLFVSLPALLGISLLTAFPLIEFVLWAAFLLILWKWAGKVGWGIFFCWSGTAFLIFLLQKDFSFLDGQVNWQTIGASMLPFMSYISNPSLWCAFPIIVLLMWHLKELFYSNRDGLTSGAEVALWGALPIFYLDGFVWMFFVSLFWAILFKKKGLWLRRFWSVFSLPFILLLLISHFGKVNLFSVFIFTLKNSNDWQSLISKYLLMLGPFSFAVLNFFFNPRARFIFLGFFFPGLVTFLVFVSFDPHSWVGSGAPLAALGLLLMGFYFYHISLFYSHFVKIALYTFFFLPGFLMYVYPAFPFLKETRPIYTDEQLTLACEAAKKLDPHFLTATTMQHYHPLAQCGVPLVSIFNDAFFHLNTAERKNSEKLREFILGNPGWRKLAEALGIRYVFWSDLEQNDFVQLSTQVWRNSSQKIFEGPGLQVFDLGDLTVLGELPQQGEGLLASLYNNERWDGTPASQRLVRDVNFQFNNTSQQSILNPPYGIKFEGEIYIPKSGDVEFYLASDDGSLLEIANEIIINNDGNHAFMIKKGTKNFSEGWYPFKLHFNNTWGSAALMFWWRLPGEKEDWVKVSNFRPKSAEKSGL